MHNSPAGRKLQDRQGKFYGIHCPITRSPWNQFKPFHIVLVEPEIPPNTGNIARLCGATRSVLHLVGKLGFATDDRTLKRAGLDYWHTVDIRYWSNLEELTATFPEGRFIYTSKKAARSYVAMNFRRRGFHRLRQGDPGTPRGASGRPPGHEHQDTDIRRSAKHQPRDFGGDHPLRSASPDGEARG